MNVTEELRRMCWRSRLKSWNWWNDYKVKAAKIAAESGVDMVFANGDEPSILLDIIRR